MSLFIGCVLSGIGMSSRSNISKLDSSNFSLSKIYSTTFLFPKYPAVVHIPTKTVKDTTHPSTIMAIIPPWRYPPFRERLLLPVEIVFSEESALVWPLPLLALNNFESPNRKRRDAKGYGTWSHCLRKYKTANIHRPLDETLMAEASFLDPNDPLWEIFYGKL